MVDRLKVFEDKLDDAIARIGQLETRMDSAETIRNEIATKLETIESFVGGYNTIMGLAKKHWKSIFIFGAGVVSTAGVGNPTVQHLADYVGKFLGAH